MKVIGIALGAAGVILISIWLEILTGDALTKMFPDGNISGNAFKVYIFGMSFPFLVVQGAMIKMPFLLDLSWFRDKN